MRFKVKMSLSRILKSLLILPFLVTFLAIPFISGLSETTIKIQTVELPGVTGAVNNVLFIDDRYVLVAPYAPTVSEETDEEEDLDVESLDNHYIYLIDTKKPNSKLIRADLKTCYFPSRIQFDTETKTVFVRGTEFYTDKSGNDASREVITHIHLNIDENGKPFFEPDLPVSIPIRGTDTEFSTDAPTDFVLGHKGQILVFTNGKAIYTYKVATGDIYPVYFANNDDNEYVTHLDIDEESNTLFISLTRRAEKQDGQIETTSQLMFYRLRIDGTVDLIKQVRQSIEGQPIDIIPGSNAAILNSLDSVTGEYSPDAAYFVTADGRLSHLDMRSSGLDGYAEGVAYFSELAQADSEFSSARKITYNRSKRTLSIIKRGQTWDIRRPTFNRPRKIRRPTFIRGSEPVAVVLVQLNKKNKVVRQKAFAQEFGDTDGLSNQVFDGNRLILAGFDGKLYSLDLSGDLDSAAPSLMGEIGDRIDFIAGGGSSAAFVAISSFEADEDGQRMAHPGSLAIAKLTSGSSQLSSSLVRTLFHPETLAVALRSRFELIK